MTGPKPAAPPLPEVRERLSSCFYGLLQADAHAREFAKGAFLMDDQRRKAEGAVVSAELSQATRQAMLAMLESMLAILVELELPPNGRTGSGAGGV